MFRPIIVIFSFIFVLLVVGQPGLAVPITFVSTDNHKTWPGWHNGINDAVDSLGIIDVYRVAVTVDQSAITRVSFYYWLDNLLMRPADLFIDANNDRTWDYVGRIFDPQSPIPPESSLFSVYRVNLSYQYPSPDQASYLYAYWSPDPSTYRAGHPIAVEESILNQFVGYGFYSGWRALKTPTTFTLYLAPIPISHTFTIAWTTQCANDVVFESFSIPSPWSMPEPATIWLMLLFLLVVVCWRKFSG